MKLHKNLVLNYIIEERIDKIFKDRRLSLPEKQKYNSLVGYMIGVRVFPNISPYKAAT